MNICKLWKEITASSPKPKVETAPPKRSKNTFEIAFEFVVRPDIEGSYVNDPRDPGGETKYGISKRAYPKVDIKNLTLEQAKKIYHDDYWLPCDCAEMLPRPAKLLVFDCAVNQGVSVARKLWALSKDRDDPCAWFMMLRARRYTQTRNYDVYGRGWFVRLFKAMEASSKIV